MEKLLTIGVIILFIGMTISSTTGINLEEQSINPVSAEGTLYVGGSGPNNFTRIQDAIDNASNDDIVFVYSGTYFERVKVNKSISLLGENQSTTFIDGGGKNDVVYISANYVNIAGFTVMNSGDNYGSPDAGIDVRSDYTCIVDNIVKDNLIGIYLFSASNNNISGNTVKNNKKGGIRVNEYTYKNIISGNVISNNDYDGIALVGFRNNYNHNISRNSISLNSNGIYIAGSSDNYLFGNKIENNSYVGIHFGGESDGNIISYNKIYNHNLRGIYLEECSNTSISCNNFINNRVSALFGWCYFDNKWNGNFWEKPRLLPKPIVGSMRFFIQSFEIIIPWFQFDWHPAIRPYDIPDI